MNDGRSFNGIESDRKNADSIRWPKDDVLCQRLDRIVDCIENGSGSEDPPNEDYLEYLTPRQHKLEPLKNKNSDNFLNNFNKKYSEDQPINTNNNHKVCTFAQRKRCFNLQIKNTS